MSIEVKPTYRIIGSLFKTSKNLVMMKNKSRWDIKIPLDIPKVFTTASMIVWKNPNDLGVVDDSSKFLFTNSFIRHIKVNFRTSIKYRII